MLRLFIVLFTCKKLTFVFYSAFNLCYRPLCNALAGDLINIVIWIMNGDDTGELEGGCRGEMLRRAPGCCWEAGGSCPACSRPSARSRGPGCVWDTGAAQLCPGSASFVVLRRLGQVSGGDPGRTPVSYLAVTTSVSPARTRVCPVSLYPGDLGVSQACRSTSA